MPPRFTWIGHRTWRRLHTLPERLPAPEPLPRGRVLEHARNLIRWEFDERTWQLYLRTAVEGHSTSIVAAEFETTPSHVRQARGSVQRRLQQQVQELLHRAGSATDSP